MAGFGQVLRAAREEQGLGVEDVHQRTLVSTRNIILIEEENWDELPEDVHVKGYVRSYARLLGLDSEALWQQALDSRNRPAEPKPSILTTTATRESGEVRLVAVRQEAAVDEEPGESDAEALQADLKVIATHLWFDAETSSPKIRSRRPHPASSPAEADGAATGMGLKDRATTEERERQLPLINSRSEPGSRGNLVQLRPETSAVDQLSSSPENETSPPENVHSPDRESSTIHSEAEQHCIANDGISQERKATEAFHRVDFPGFQETTTQDMDRRRRQKTALQRKRMLKVRRQRVILTLLFWVALLGVLLYALLFYDGGRIGTELWLWLQALVYRA